MKIRFIEPGNRPYRRSLLNYVVYDRYIRTPSVGLNTLATIVKREIPDTYMYSESISKIKMDDVLDADIIFMGFFTFAAIRGYELADYFRKNSRAVVVLGGLHPSMNAEEAVKYGDYVMLGEGDETILPLIHAIEKNRKPDFPGIAWSERGVFQTTGMPEPPVNIDIIPDRNLVHNYQKMAGHMTIWPQVHASRGCPHNCDYCALVRHFGHKVRTRSPQNVVDDIKYSIDFFHKKHFRLIKDLWITEDESFAAYHKKSTVQEIEASIRNIHKHGLSVRGLFILGSDHQKKGCGKALADFVIKNKIQGVLIQCMYFVPGTPSYEQNIERLLHRRWDKYNGNTVHRPKNMTPYELQMEHIEASKRIYSVKRLIRALIFEDFVHKVLFIGEFLWHWSIRSDLKKELKNLPRE